MTVVNDKIGMFGADLSVADLSAFELELIVNNPTGGFCSPQIFDKYLGADFEKLNRGNWWVEQLIFEQSRPEQRLWHD